MLERGHHDDVRSRIAARASLRVLESEHVSREMQQQCAGVPADHIFMWNVQAASVARSRTGVTSSVPGRERQDHALGKVADEAHGVGFRRGEGHVVVEAQVGVTPLLPHDLGKGRLTTLARPMDQDRGRVRERLEQACSCESRMGPTANRKSGHRLIARLLYVHMKETCPSM